MTSTYLANVTGLINTHPLQDASSMSLPPSLVFYAARNILLPTFIIGQIPDFLNLLTTIETLRRYALEKSNEALQWQKYYEQERNDGRKQSTRLLTAIEVCTLHGILNRRDAQRREYVTLVRTLIQLHIHYLYTAPESCLMWKRFNDFFPGSIEGFDGPSELLFHSDLSHDEKIYFKYLKVERQEWLKLVTEWECEREETFRKEGFIADFHNAFPPPCESFDVTRNVEIFINEVENIICKLEHIWKSQTLRSASCIA